jgi:hypothetical protein
VRVRLKIVMAVASWEGSMPRELFPILLAHAAPDQFYAQQIAAFLESGCDVRCDLGLLGPGQDLVELAEQCVDPLILLLSKDSWPKRLPRERWDPLLLKLPLASVLLNPCPFPELLRRRAFFDNDRPNAARGLKRWLWQQRREVSQASRFKWSEELEKLYVGLADRAGAQTASAVEARLFALEASAEFECVVWIPCHGRTLTECTGQLGTKLGLTMDEPERKNRHRVLEALRERRCLVVLDAPSDETRAALDFGGRSSVLVTTERFESQETPRTFHYARELVRNRRYAEAYDLLYLLMEDSVDTSACARELTWICEHWGRTAEAERLRQHNPAPVRQLGLFE